MIHHHISQKGVVVAALLASAASVSAFVFWMVHNKKQGKKTVKSLLKKPEELEKLKWESVGRVSKVWLYPVKSCAPVTLQTAQAWPLGLTDGKMRDRSFMFMTEKGTMITGCMIGTTVQIKPSVSDNTLTLSHEGAEDLTVNLDEVEENKKVSASNVFKDPVPGLDCGDVAAQWLEKVLKKKARLLYHSCLPSPRKTEVFVGQYPLMKGDDNALYADQFPYMLMTRESVADLQSRVTCPITAENFRPNILVEGTSKPYDEDDWAYIRIGDAIFRNLSPCSRCVFTTVDHKTGIKEPNMEPLRTLRTFRQKDDTDSPFFGINIGIELIGSISENDEVFATRFSQM